MNPDKHLLAICQSIIVSQFTVCFFRSIEIAFARQWHTNLLKSVDTFSTTEVYGLKDYAIEEIRGEKMHDLR